MVVAHKIAKSVFTMFVMVMVLVAATISASHIDGAMDDGSVITIMAKASCHDAAQNDDDSHGKLPHSCCMAHCMSMKAATSEMGVTTVQPYAVVTHIVDTGDVVPNQYLKGLFRPPRTLA